MKSITATCYRYNKETDKEAYYKTYDIPVEENNSISVYNVLEYIYDNLDPTLSFFSHAACKQVACGRCSVKVNGSIVLACKEAVTAENILIEPVNEAKVIKDLICSK